MCIRDSINAVERVLHIKFDLDEAQTDSRIVRVNALPMGINYELYNHSSATPKVWSEIEKKRILFRNHKLLLSVDRLDYSKGILHRLQGFETFLERHPEYQGKVTPVSYTHLVTSVVTLLIHWKTRLICPT